MGSHFQRVVLQLLEKADLRHREGLHSQAVGLLSRVDVLRSPTKEALVFQQADKVAGLHGRPKVAGLPAPKLKAAGSHGPIRAVDLRSPVDSHLRNETTADLRHLPKDRYPAGC